MSNSYDPNHQYHKPDSKIPWLLIILAFCFAPPVGVVLGIIRLLQKGTAGKKAEDAWNRARQQEWSRHHQGGQNWQNGNFGARPGRNAGQSQAGQPGANGWQGQDGTYHYSYRYDNAAQDQTRAPNRSGYTTAPQQGPAFQPGQFYSRPEQAGATQGTEKKSRRAAQRPAEDASAAAARKEAESRGKIIRDLTNTKAGRGLFTGGVITALSGIFITGSTILENLEALTSGVMLGAAMEDVYSSLLVLVVGVVLCYFGRRKTKRAQKAREYLAITENQISVSLHDLSNITGVSYKKVCDDLQDLLERGAFGSSAYLDVGKNRLVLDPAAVAQADAKAAEQSGRAEKKPADTDPSMALLNEIRSINDAIPDPRLSAQIDRIEEITRLILKCQEEHPEKAEKLHSFLSYYLPTTLKILKSYAEMEKQSIQGENITATKARIEAMMDKVVLGFETQLDQLFAGDRMDIAADISVLEQMMAKDGLTSSAAVDFGGMAAQTKP